METGQNVWVVTCNMEGCDDLNDGSSSILLITDNEKLAVNVQREHDLMQSEHLHYASVDVKQYQFNIANHRWGVENVL